MAHMTEYVSPYMLLYDDKIWHFWKLFGHMVGSFQCYCCLTVLQCHVPIMNNIPYYTMLVWHVEECRHSQVRCTPPAHWTQCYRVADVSISDVIPHLGNQTQCYRALLHHVTLTCTRMEVYQCHIYTPSKLNLVLESCPILCQFDMWKNADVHRSDVTPHNPC